MEGVTYSNQLMQNFPNPFNAETTITYSLSQSEYVSLILYDLNGRRIKNLVQDFKSAGYHYVRLNGMNLSNGLYFYRLATPTFTQTAKLLLLK